MRRPRAFILVTLATYAAQTSAQALLSVISSRPELSTLSSYIQKFPRLLNKINKADNYTLLAPANNAIDIWINKNSLVPTSDDIEATLTYHLLHGGYPAVSFVDSPQLASSFLTNTSYTNVTTGQNVILVLNSNGQPQLISGNRSISSIFTADIVANGGIIHIIDTVLKIPGPLQVAITEAKLNFFVAVLNKGNLLSAANNAFALRLTIIPDSTIFAPNTAAALDQTSKIIPGLNQSALFDLYKYHVVSNATIPSTRLQNGRELQTIEGDTVIISVAPDGSKYVNSVEILTPDLLIANGIIHTIDGVLDPSNQTVPTLPSPTPAQPTNSASATATATSVPESSKSLSPGAQAGVGIGVTALLLSLAGVGTMLFRRKRNPSHAGQASPRKISDFPFPFSRHFNTSSTRTPSRPIVHNPVDERHKWGASLYTRSSVAELAGTGTNSSKSNITTEEKTSPSSSNSSAGSPAQKHARRLNLSRKLKPSDIVPVDTEQQSPANNMTRSLSVRDELERARRRALLRERNGDAAVNEAGDEDGVPRHGDIESIRNRYEM